ncbi:hypothetical protein T440DRAFT_469413 [Plenodomus tracheiphilus IPT5]|uniref:C-CAP/cofactor C-like domain-containing protein n=1 Tax=Plenodomus tracheiphilus IPT5 TaxID=1408161 RepID=A0A6A7B206_9PLEO|nr:hypothetical protein T440DRAFT_469413 [Plenodomus tracheiphilus IPT5]
MATATASAEAGLKERFFRHFQDEVKALQAQIDNLKDTSASGGERNEAVDNCFAGIDRLSHEVKDASSYIPAYDQRTYSQAIKALSESLQTVKNSFNPPKKFAFKSRKGGTATSTTATTDAAPPAQPKDFNHPITSPTPSSDTSQSTPLQPQDPTTSSPSIPIPPGPGIHRPSIPPTSQITLSNLSNKHIILPPSSSATQTTATLSNLSNCIIDLSAFTSPPPSSTTTIDTPTSTSPSPPTTPLATLYLKSTSNSLILTGRINGAIHITQLSNSVLVTTCRQFRMHASHKVNVYLHARSRPIIEDCSGIGFAPLPSELNTTNPLSAAVPPNQWDQIDDFKWLRSGASPNFRLLGEEERIKEEVWERVGKAKDGELDGLLELVGR